ncbi:MULTISPECIES: ParB N-terminal domain-containing protein [unclassified Mesorhizobium]|uniref:ParB N-terminal domain-containing protein n=1 Tax=unclassified Mesorhizobium TaxID=325217 RepID=UPI0016766366|nr:MULTISPECIES: ParB N-terminal domain-containing protein [unclassified Mesorhizobium]
MSQPGSGDVHVPSTQWPKGKKPKKDAMAKDAPRSLKPLDEDTAHTPFPYDATALGNLRSDQKPRFFGVLTNPELLPDKTLPVDSLVAMQNRVDPKKVEALRGVKHGKPPVVVHMNGRNYIADGHHRASAAWLDGEDNIPVKYKDLEPVSNAMKMADPSIRICKVDESLGMVFGWAIVCKINGEDYYDLNIDKGGERVPEHIPEDAMLKATIDFMSGARAGNEMHAGPDKGTFVCAWPMTTEIAKTMGITTDRTGLMVAYRPPADVLAKFKSGEYTGFSIEGARLSSMEQEV